MVSPYLLARKPDVELPPVLIPELDEAPVLTLQSLDGSRKIVLDGLSGWTHMPGSTGLEMPPYELITSSIPGVYGSVLEDVRVEERPIFIPIDAASADFRMVSHQAMLDQIRALVDPLRGEFYVICGNKQLKVAYTSGLEGSFGVSDFGLYWRKFGLKALATQPFAEDRLVRPLEFQTVAGGSPFLGLAGGTDVPWGTRAITSGSVISDNMPVNIDSEVPVYPTLELVGPMNSFSADVELDNPLSSLSTQKWSVSVPQGVPDGYTLRMVTDPRARSIRMGVGDPAVDASWSGDLAAGRVARGSSLSPFYPGVNRMNVSAPGGTDKTRVRIIWRNLNRSLW